MSIIPFLVDRTVAQNASSQEEIIIALSTELKPVDGIFKIQLATTTLFKIFLAEHAEQARQVESLLVELQNFRLFDASITQSGLKAQLLPLMGAQNYQHILQLANSTSLESYFSDLLTWAKELKGTHPEQAGAILQMMSSDARNPLAIYVPAHIRDQAKMEFDNLRGEGKFAGRLEYLLQNSLPQIFDSEYLVPGLLANASLPLVRTGVMGLLTKTPLRGTLAKMVTGTTTFASFGPLFSGYHEGLLAMEGKESKLPFWHVAGSGWINYGVFFAMGGLARGMMNTYLQLGRNPQYIWWGMPNVTLANRWTALALPTALQYWGLGYAKDLEFVFGLRPDVPDGPYECMDRMATLVHMGLATRIPHLMQEYLVPKLGPLNYQKASENFSRQLGFYPKVETATPFNFRVPEIEGIPATWNRTYGSGLRTSTKVQDTKQWVQVIVKDGILKMFGEENIDLIFGYGSYPEFGGKTSKGHETNIRKFDADKTADFIVIAKDSQKAISHLASLWNLSAGEKAKLQQHAEYNKDGFREGFVYFNTDILVPGMGPLPFKVSVVSSKNFFATSTRLDFRQKADIGYAQVRLSDAHASNLLWSRSNPDYFGNQAVTAMEAKVAGQLHLEKIRDTMMLHSYMGQSWGLGTLLMPWRWPALFRGYQFTGTDLVRRFFQQTFRPSMIRFWENGPGPFDKGSKVFKQRKGVVDETLFPAFQRFANSVTHSFELSVKGSAIRPEEITSQNMYDVTFTSKQGVFATLKMNSGLFWKEVPAFAKLNLRELFSYVKHGLKSEKFSRAFYKKSHAEYAGRKGRGVIKMDEVKDASEIASWQKMIVAWLTNPSVPSGFITSLLQPLKVFSWPIFKIVQLDTTRMPLYYSSIPKIVNGLYTSEKIDLAGHESLMRWYSSDPKLAGLRDVELLKTLQPILNSADTAERNAAQSFLKSLPVALMEKSAADFIKSNIHD